MGNVGDDKTEAAEHSNVNLNLPPGLQLEPEFSSILGDAVQSWSFLYVFHEALCLKKRISLKEFIAELTGVSSSRLYEAHISMLTILLEWRENDIWRILNALTWPELARRYVLVSHSSEGEKMDSSQARDISCCLYGDGGSARSSSTGLKVETLLFASATSAIYGFLNHGAVFVIDDTHSDSGDEHVSPTILTNHRIPEWVQILEPVKSMRTNVGSKIRTCIRESIEKCPEEWAKELLEKSISKEVYKGNASGPTKNTALRVVERFYKMEKDALFRQKRGKSISISDIVLRKCRILLRQTANEFCKLFKVNHRIGFPPVVMRPLAGKITCKKLDFRTIDMRLGAGLYCGSHQAFEEDMLELLSISRRDYPDLVQKFEEEYKKEVVALHKKLLQYSELKSFSPDSRKDIEGILSATNEIPKVPWDETWCEVCAKDQDDEEILLCDGCNEGYHMYCLSPPLSETPKGDWFCPSCFTENDSASAFSLTCQEGMEFSRNLMKLVMEEANDLAAMLQEREYWELNAQERLRLLKFFEDESLDMETLRKHLKSKVKGRKGSESFSFRNKFLGVDSTDRLYWKLDVGSYGCIVVAEKSKPHQQSVIPQYSGPIDAEHLSLSDDAKVVFPSDFEEICCGETSAYSSWVCYQSEDEIKRIVNFIKGDKLMKEQLNESSLQELEPKQNVQSCSSQSDNTCSSRTYPLTRATILLGCGPSSESGTKKLSDREILKGKIVPTDNIYRCGCLEAIPPRQLHCPHCHKTYMAGKDLKSHGGGLCGIPPLMPFKDKEMCNTSEGEGTSRVQHADEFQKEQSKKTQHPQVDETQRVGSSEGTETKNIDLPTHKVDAKFDIDKFVKVPVSSTRPLKDIESCEVLKHLKMSLLDMEVAIPEGALRSARARLDRKHAWRAYVKHANTIYKMVQATIVFEDMIKPNYLGESWKNWGSIVEAAKISTLAALALRIYALDAAINPEPQPLEGKPQHEQMSGGKRQRKLA